jgi:hypothetical protein
MSTTVDSTSSFVTGPWKEGDCRLAVFYEDAIARDRAMALSDHLAQAFWKDLDLSVSWWGLRYLEDPEISEAAAIVVLEADVLIFSALAANSPPQEVHLWLGLWTPHRKEGLGVLVPLLHPSTAEALSSSPWMMDLEDIARQTGLECLLPAELQDSPLFHPAARSLHERSHRISGVLDDILHQHPPLPPAHWGLNE